MRFYNASLFGSGGSYAPSYLGRPFGSRPSGTCIACRGAGGCFCTGHRQRIVGLGRQCGRAGAAEKGPPSNAGEKPAAEKPAGEKPAAEKPAGEKPAAEKPPAGKGGGVAGPRPKGKELEPAPKTKKEVGERAAAEKPAREKVADERPPEEKVGGEESPAEKAAKESVLVWLYHSMTPRYVVIFLGRDFQRDRAGGDDYPGTAAKVHLSAVAGQRL